ncbi:hypothetical protein GCK72_006637 [Caenorhabditis remanei]|uniref:Protein kinase domain-containing protein n=1 Tax=Caenorhabditis remanei TaxID=31234 RepID=A0A6A5HH70_CAERE|nr:hypothetical protein GCK72_006637 [Caenorhabditis remanei]KAF1766679.1 hypothetical protein GCK72_006637 [Caenorhabditis remanei]
MLPLSSVDLTEINVEDLEIKGECLARFQLGQGAIADIFHVFYKGHDAVLKRPRNNYTDQEKIEIRREARVVAALNNCENVVRIYGICDTMPFNGIIMEYCAGPNLSELVFKLYESRVEMETIRIFKWCHELSKTLCELNVTYFHGDVKTENVIVKERPCYCQNGVYKDVTIRDTTYHLCQACHGVHLEHLSLKFCDFGKSYEHGTKERNFGGTAEFAAPETIQRGEYTQKSEVYTFGHLMLILVIGFPTDQCADGQRRFLQLYNNKKYDLSGCKSNSICEIISWCLDKNAENRPTFKQLLEKLNSRFDHYKSLRGDDKKSAAHIANIEREEFLEHYKIPRKITMGHRTVTTSTFLSISTYSSNSQLDLSATYYGGPLDNDVFEETPLPSPSTSRKFNDGYELARSFVENTLYTGDEWVPRKKCNF